MFAALGARLASDANLAASVGAVLQFTVDGKSWTVDLSAAPGSVREGAADKAAALFTIGDEDLVALASGSKSAQDLYQHGQLRVDGNIRLAHQLGFLKGLV